MKALRWPGKLEKVGTESSRITREVKGTGRLRRLIFLGQPGLFEGAEVMETVGSA